MTKGPYDPRGRIGVILAYGLVGFLVAFALYTAIQAWNDPSGKGQISENATQILSTVAGGIIGILAGYVGGLEASERKANREPEVEPEPEVEDEPED